MKLRTWLTERLGIRYPIVQGAFHRFGTSEIAGPVSAAGGLGMITAHNFPSPEELRVDIRRARAMTANPIAVNFTVMPATAGKATKAGRPCDNWHPWLEATLDEGIRAIFTSAYDGSPIGQRAKEAGAVWVHKCATIRHAVSASKKGADAIVIVGIEGGGFKNPNQNTTFVNITALRRVIPLPLIAAGGIGDGRGVAAAIAMGACGVYMGTAFMATKECPISNRWKQVIRDQDITDPKYHGRVLNLGGGEQIIHSMASGVIDRVKTVREFIDDMILEMNEACNALK